MATARTFDAPGRLARLTRWGKRRMGRVNASGSGVFLRFYFDDADPSIECECGWHCHGDSANDAWAAWWRHLHRNHEELV